jgi:hypothetical protein
MEVWTRNGSFPQPVVVLPGLLRASPDTFRRLFGAPDAVGADSPEWVRQHGGRAGDGSRAREQPAGRWRYEHFPWRPRFAPGVRPRVEVLVAFARTADGRGWESRAVAARTDGSPSWRDYPLGWVQPETPEDAARAFGIPPPAYSRRLTEYGDAEAYVIPQPLPGVYVALVDFSPGGWVTTVSCFATETDARELEGVPFLTTVSAWCLLSGEGVVPRAGLAPPRVKWADSRTSADTATPRGSTPDSDSSGTP